MNALRVRLLRAFPVRAPSQQLSLLDHLLGQALRYADRAALKTVVDKKLRAKSTTASQKMRWLVAAALFSPEQYRAELGAFIGTNNEKTRHLAEMLRGLSEN